MKPPLSKNDRRRFDVVCKTIRTYLHLDHLEQEYVIEENDDGAIASTKVFAEGWRLLIYIKPCFWGKKYEMQMRHLIHEHVHVCLHPYHQAFDGVEHDWVSQHDRSQVGEKNRIGGEIAVDHLTEVFYRLLKNKL